MDRGPADGVVRSSDRTRIALQFIHITQGRGRRGRDVMKQRSASERATRDDIRRQGEHF